MKYAILSDIHSNLQALEVVLEKCQQEKVDKIICLGDIVGYNANPKECLKLAKKHFALSVQGNHDDLSSREITISDFREWSSTAIIGVEYAQSQITKADKNWLKSLKLFDKIDDLKIPFSIGHGMPCPRKYRNPFDYVLGSDEAIDTMRDFKKNDKDIRLGFFGHTHLPSIIRGYNGDEHSNLSDLDIGSYIFEPDYGMDEINLEHLVKGDEFILINPGSVGQPRSFCPPSFAILDTEEEKVTITTFDYDVESAKKAIIEAKYCDKLAKRLDYENPLKKL